VNYMAFTEDDLIIFTGDYVDKGPDVRGTIEQLIEFNKQYQCVFLRGNHDQFFIDACNDNSKISLWECLAGSNPLKSYGEGEIEFVLEMVPESHRDFLTSTCVDYFETDQYIFVHGGIRPHMDPSDEEVERLQWSALALASPHESGKTVICGHSAQVSGDIMDLGHTICIDTGVTKNQRLTCLNLENFSYTQISHSLEIRSGELR